MTESRKAFSLTIDGSVSFESVIVTNHCDLLL
jgi:hypothetical protein